MFRNNSTPLVAGAAVVAVLAALLFQGKGSTPADGGNPDKPAGKNPVGKPEEAASVLETVGRYFNPEPKAKGAAKEDAKPEPAAEKKTETEEKPKRTLKKKTGGGKEG